MTTLQLHSPAVRPARTAWAAVLVVLHLFAAPCATAMVLMPADGDCEHCQTIDGTEHCAVATELASTVIDGLAFDAGRADPPLRTPRVGDRLPAVLTPAASGPVALFQWPRTLGARLSGDLPLYLTLGQLRI